MNEPGPWFGARVYVRPDLRTGGLETELIPQVSFRKKGTERRVWFTISDLSLKKADDLAEYRNETETQIIGPSWKACEHVRKRIEALGICFTEHGRLDKPITDSGQMLTSVQCTVDSVILRGIAKIAFEYLVYVQGADIALLEDFDPIRGFIRHGHNAASTPVWLRRDRILAGETSAIRCTRGHVLTVQWPALSDDIMARVSLFNDAVYEIRLCHGFTGIWRDLRTGHHLDIESGEATRLQAVSATLLI